MGFPDGSVVKNPPAKHPMLVWNLGQEDWWRKWQPTPVFWPQKSHRQRSLVVTVHGVAKNWTRLSYQTTTTKQKYKQSMWKWGTPTFHLGDHMPTGPFCRPAHLCGPQSLRVSLCSSGSTTAFIFLLWELCLFYHFGSVLLTSGSFSPALGRQKTKTAFSLRSQVLYVFHTNSPSTCMVMASCYIKSSHTSVAPTHISRSSHCLFHKMPLTRCSAAKT